MIKPRNTNRFEAPVFLSTATLALAAPSKALWRVSAVVVSARPATNRVFSWPKHETAHLYASAEPGTFSWWRNLLTYLQLSEAPHRCDPFQLWPVGCRSWRFWRTAALFQHWPRLQTRQRQTCGESQLLGEGPEGNLFHKEWRKRWVTVFFHLSLRWLLAVWQSSHQQLF